MKKIFQYTLAVLSCFLSLNLQGIEYTIQDIGTLANAESHVTGINNQNAVVGYTKQGDKTNSFIWELKRGLVFLPHPNYQAPLINNLNQAVDIFWHRTSYWFSENIRSKHIYIYDAGLVRDIGFPEQWKSQKLQDWQQSPSWDDKELGILAFNDQQQILISNAKRTDEATKFAVWQKGIFNEIDASMINNAYGMNNQGLILGRKWIQKEDRNIPMLVLYDPSQGTVVEIIEDVRIFTRELNDQGQVIIFQILSESDFKGFLWDSEKGLIDLGDFAPIALNNCNQIIGAQISKIKEKLVPLMWVSGEIISLAPVFEHPDAFLWTELLDLKKINDNGYIIGEGVFEGKKHAFVLVPQTSNQ